MTYYENEKINDLIDVCLKKEEPTDICRYWYFWGEGIKVLNKKELTIQMTMFKNRKKYKIEDYNNRMIKRNGRKFYMLVIQYIDEDKEMNMCPMSLLGYGVMVDGFPYWFNTKKDRDYAIKIFNSTT